MTFRERATALVNKGFSVIPIAPRDKSPIGPGATSRTKNPDLIDAWAYQWPDANVGICADENVTILESDDAPRLCELLGKLGVTLPATMTGGASEGRPHWFYQRTPECGEDCLTVALAIRQISDDLKRFPAVMTSTKLGADILSGLADTICDHIAFKR